NISDIAAKGGFPTFAFLSFALPKNLSVSWVDSFFNGFQILADKYNIILAGGNTCTTPGPIFIDICLMGEVQKKFLKLRSGAKLGDIICVTGTLGDSRGGLKLILEKKNKKNFPRLVKASHRPRPHIEEGSWLGQQKPVHAMIDVFDGLASELKGRAA